MESTPVVSFWTILGKLLVSALDALFNDEEAVKEERLIGTMEYPQDTY